MLRPVVMTLVTLCFACGSSSTCSSDGDCSNGLRCLEVDSFYADGGCVPLMKICSKVCTSNSDCSGISSASTLDCSATCGQVLRVCAPP
jgi:hypothetical protein